MEILREFFFRDPALTSQITGLSEELLRRSNVILRTLSSGFEIDTCKFDEYATDTARILVNEYGWYKMPPSIHKILIHGGEIIKNAILPIGTLSEEAQEALNHQFKYIRQQRTRKRSRLHTAQDILQYLILFSDPYITLTSNGKLHRAPSRKALLPEVLALLREPDGQLNLLEQPEESDEDCDEDDDST